MDGDAATPSCAQTNTGTGTGPSGEATLDGGAIDDRPESSSYARGRPEVGHGRENPEDEEKLEARLELAYKANPQDIEVAFELLGILVVRYRLHRSDEVLGEIAERCLADDAPPKQKVKFYQSRAFVRYKQGRFADCISDFLMQEQLVIKGFAGGNGGADEKGLCKSVALNENIGHCFSSMGKLEEAEERFQAALKLLKSSVVASKEGLPSGAADESGDIGGIYLGLGLVKDRLGNTEGAVVEIQNAVTHYKTVHGSDGSSLVAKALSSLGRCTEKMGKLEEAAKCYDEAAVIFRKRASVHSVQTRRGGLRRGEGPLLAGALCLLGKNQVKRKLFADATITLLSAVELEVEKDALDLNTVWEQIEAIKACMIGLIESRGKITEDVIAVAKSGKRAALLAIEKTSQDWRKTTGGLDSNAHGTAALIYMLEGEFSFAVKDFADARESLETARTIFKRIEGFECCSLVETCEALLSAIHGGGPGQKSD